MWSNCVFEPQRQAMIHIVLVIHLLLAIAIVTTVLLQRSEGGGLGIGGGGGGGGGGFMTTRGSANLLTRATAILAACFFCTSLALAILYAGAGEPRSFMDQQQTVPAPPTAPAEPQAPLAQ